jgi:hypothetical protein
LGVLCHGADPVFAGGGVGRTIGSVRIEGIQRIEPETVRSYLLVQTGDPGIPSASTAR